MSGAAMEQIRAAQDALQRTVAPLQRERARLQRTTLRTSRLLDFASEKELVAQTGHRPEQWPLVVLKELVDNAIDAAEEAGTSPVIEVTVDSKGIEVTDKGPGIPADVVTNVLDFAVRVSSREAYVSPTRGAQGNALKTIVAMPYVLDGNRGRIEIETRGVLHMIEMGVDRIRQEPTITHNASPVAIGAGTRVLVSWPESPRSDLRDAKQRFLQIAADYAWLNPHLSLAVSWFSRREVWEATAETWEKWGPSDPTSPHWYDVARLERLVAGYVAHDQDAGRDRTVRELVAEFRGLTGSAKQKAVLEATGLARAPLSTLVRGGEIDNEAVQRLLAAMRGHSKPVKPQHLGTIGKGHFEQRFAAVGCEMKSFDYKRVMNTTDGVPWVVETAFGYCPNIEARRLVTGVNWSPGILNPFRELGTYGRSLDTLLSKQYCAADEPVVMVLHMACPRVEYTDRGKSAVVVRT